MRIVFTPLAMLLALTACEQATQRHVAIPSVPPAAAEPTPPGQPPAAGGSGGPSPSAPAPITPPSAGGGTAGAPLPSVTNIVFEITTGRTPRTANRIALPPIDGTRHENTVIVPSIRVPFPSGFTYSRNATYERHEFGRREQVNTLTQDRLTRGTVAVTYSLDGGSIWSSQLEHPNGHFHSRPTWGRDPSGGWIKLTIESPGVPDRRGDRANNHHYAPADATNNACHSASVSPSGQTTTFAAFTQLTFKQGSSARATAVPILTNGVLTSVHPGSGNWELNHGEIYWRGTWGTSGRVTHHSGTFTDPVAVTVTWNDYFGEPQRGSGAVITPTITNGKISAVTITSGGTGYLERCGTSNTLRSDVDYTNPGYWLVSELKYYIRYYGSESILVRFAIISPS